MRYVYVATRQIQYKHFISVYIKHRLCFIQTQLLLYIFINTCILNMTINTTRVHRFIRKHYKHTFDSFKNNVYTPRFSIY